MNKPWTFDHLALSKPEAQELLTRYWSLRGPYLDALRDYALTESISLPGADKGYLPRDLLPLGAFLYAILYAHPRPLHCPPVPEWLFYLHAPFGVDEGHTNDHTWLGVATSYAYADSVLKTVKGVKLQCGNLRIKRYVDQNLPVLHGKWYERGVVPDVPPLAVGAGTVSFVRRGKEGPDGLYKDYIKIIAFARTQGWVNEDGLESNEKR